MQQRKLETTQRKSERGTMKVYISEAVEGHFTYLSIYSMKTMGLNSNLNIRVYTDFLSKRLNICIPTGLS